MFKLTPASEQALGAFCSSLTDSQARALREVIDRVCADPSGRREPHHSYSRPFRSPQRYVGRQLPQGVKVWEFKTNHCRGLFITDAPFLAFLAVRGRRFMTPDQCPWH